MRKAFDVWDDAVSIEEMERRIHDGVPLQKLRERARSYVNGLAEFFPWTLPKPEATILEVGSGLAYIMEEVLRRFHPAKIVGLDVSENMIRMAKARLSRDGMNDTRIQFMRYDGVRIPIEENSYDYVYSVATIQHIPKPFAYNLMGEMLRVIKPHGYVAFCVLSFSHLPVQEKHAPFRDEQIRQIRGHKGHWHHFYSFEELFHVLGTGYGVRSLDIRRGGSALWVSYSKTGKSYYHENLPELIFQEKHLRIPKLSSYRFQFLRSNK